MADPVVVRMFGSRAALTLLLSGSLAACTGDSGGPQILAAAIEITTEPGGAALAGLPLPTPPVFVVKDLNGNGLSGVAVKVTVTAGGGSLANSPTTTSAEGTSVGTWILGRAAGVNTLSISTAGLAPLTISVNSAPGAASRLVAVSSTHLAGTVGQPVSAPVVVRVTDGFDNGVAAISLGIATSGGGTAPPTVSSDASGAATISAWTLGTVKGVNTLTVSLGTTTISFAANAAAAALQSFNIVSGNNQSAFAGTAPAQPVVLAPVDQYGNTLDGQVATFSVAQGGGSLAAPTASSSADGTITMPRFTLGVSALPQQAVATIGSHSVSVSATVRSSYVLDIRFWGAGLSASQQELFTNSAARIRGIVVGSLPAVDASGTDPAICGVTGVPVLAESIPGLIIFASIQPIDGPGNLVAQSAPCVTRGTSDMRTAIGVVKLDAADIATLAPTTLQDIVTHEILHVLGIGSHWSAEGLLINFNSPTVAYTGTNGIAGCRAAGGIISCMTSVPVENTGGSGTANSHWRESVFGSELMTGYVNIGEMPLSILTVRSLADMGYSINPSGADPYTIFPGNVRASDSQGTPASLSANWEEALPIRPIVLPSRRSAANTAPKTAK
ncbi:MAG: leishmanolysin-related zinc metalloendopeptidase [Gemmatimonadaceae bacterium]